MHNEGKLGKCPIFNVKDKCYICDNIANYIIIPAIL